MQAPQPIGRKPDSFQAFYRKLQPDDEQQKNDSKLADGLDGLNIGNQCQTKRTDHKPCEQIAEHRADPQFLANWNGNYSRANQNDYFLNKPCLVHALPDQHSRFIVQSINLTTRACGCDWHFRYSSDLQVAMKPTINTTELR